jgi:hypothetical protein
MTANSRLLASQVRGHGVGGPRRVGRRIAGAAAWFPRARVVLCGVLMATVGVAFAATNAGAVQTASFTVQGCSTWPVPAGVTSVTIHATGAAGASTGDASGGAGDEMSGVLSGLPNGQTLDICVDSGGTSGGNAAFTQQFSNGGTGGGASGVSLGQTFSDPVVVAGGGGGGGGGFMFGIERGDGGGAGIPIAGGGGKSIIFAGSGGGGGNNTTMQGGAAGGGDSAFSVTGGSGGAGFGVTASGPGLGGIGGNANRSGGGGGGGGGGYFAGGGGGAGAFEDGAGGGGGTDFCGDTYGGGTSIASCAPTSGAGSQTVAGSSAGDAEVVLTYLSVPTTPTIFNLPASGTVGGSFNPFVVTNSDGVTFVTDNSPAICSLSGLVVHFNAVGVCSLTAHVKASANFVAANGVPQGFNIFQGTQTPLTLTSTTGTVGTPLVLTSSGGSGTGALVYVLSGPGSAGCSLNGPGTTLSATTPGTCTVTVTKAADINYTAASSPPTAVTFSLAVFSSSGSALSASSCLPYSHNFAGGAPATFAVTAGAVPPGFSLSSAGVLSGPAGSAPGSYSFTITATPSSGPPVSRNFTLMLGLCVGPTPPVLPGGTYGVPYSYTLTTTGGTAPYRYQIQGGGLPPGLTLAANGVISGSPYVRGTYSVTIIATDSASPAHEGQSTLSITIS